MSLPLSYHGHQIDGVHAQRCAGELRKRRVIDTAASSEGRSAVIGTQFAYIICVFFYLINMLLNNVYTLHTRIYFIDAI